MEQWQASPVHFARPRVAHFTGSYCLIGDVILRQDAALGGASGSPGINDAGDITGRRNDIGIRTILGIKTRKGIAVTRLGVGTSADEDIAQIRQPGTNRFDPLDKLIFRDQCARAGVA